MKLKKAQSSIEFMVILAFIFTIVALIMYFTGTYLIEANAKEQELLAQNYADVINNELKILSKVESGYKRELILHNQNYELELMPSKIDNRPSILKLNDIYNNKTYYFDLIGNYNLDTGNLIVNLTKRSDSKFNYEVTVLTFSKIPDKDSKGLDLS